MSFYTDSSHACCSRSLASNAIPLDNTTVHNMYSSALRSTDKRDFDKVASLMAAILLIANEYGAAFSSQGRKASFWWQRKEYTVTGEDGRWSVVQSHSEGASSIPSPLQGRKRSAYDYDSGFEDDYPDKKLKPLRAPSEQHNSEQCLPSLRAIAEECQQRRSPIGHNSHDEATHQRDASHSIPPGPPLTMFLPRTLFNPDEPSTRPTNRATSEHSEPPSPIAQHQRQLHYIINGEVRTVHPLSPNKMTKSPTPLHHPVPRWEAALYIPQTPSPKPSALLNVISTSVNSTSVNYPVPIRHQQDGDNCQACQRNAHIDGDNNPGTSSSPRHESLPRRASPVSDRDVSPLALTPPRITSVEQLRSLTQVVDDVRADASVGIRSVAKAVERWEQEVARVNEVESW